MKRKMSIRNHLAAEALGLAVSMLVYSSLRTNFLWTRRAVKYFIHVGDEEVGRGQKPGTQGATSSPAARCLPTGKTPTLPQNCSQTKHDWSVLITFLTAFTRNWSIRLYLT